MWLLGLTVSTSVAYQVNMTDMFCKSSKLTLQLSGFEKTTFKPFTFYHMT